MSEHGIDLDDDWLDESLLSDDPASLPRWRRRALNGMSVNDALMGIPKNGQAIFSVPLDSFRMLQAHVEAEGRTMVGFMREAVGMKLLADGLPREALDDFLGPRG